VVSHEHQSPSVREARAAYFRDHGFGDDGGYGARWVRFQLGPVPLAIPNTRGRVRAVAYHDLHHLATGYTTSYCGEFEISAWEIGAGCKGYGAAWLINLAGLFAGLVVCPRRTIAAFLRGRAQDTLYGRDLEALLDHPLGLLQALTGATAPPAKMTAGNTLLLLLAGLAGLGAGLLLGAVGLVAAPVLALLGARAAQAGDTAHTLAPNGAHGPAS
jgi:hypothetical protein